MWPGCPIVWRTVWRSGLATFTRAAPLAAASPPLAGAPAFPCSSDCPPQPATAARQTRTGTRARRKRFPRLPRKRCGFISHLDRDSFGGRSSRRPGSGERAGLGDVLFPVSPTPLLAFALRLLAVVVRAV